MSAVTNGVAIASVLAKAPEVGGVLPGAKIRSGSFTLLGSFSKGLHVDVV